MYLSWPDQKESHHLKNFDVENHPGPSFKWSMEVYNDEKVRDMDCVIWDEPFDRDTWYDNAMCLPKDSKFEMKFLSDLADIDDWSLDEDCVGVDRPGQKESEGWWNNYFCVRRKVPETQEFSFKNL